MVSGVYSLVLYVPEDVSLLVGALGVMEFPGGLYVYTGSALGAGGLAARISRHLRSEKKVFWHIDYLTSNRRIDVLAFVKAETQSGRECEANRTICSELGATPFSGFGSSDCRSSCQGHLLSLGDMPLSVCLEGIQKAYPKAGLNPVYRTIKR